MLLCMLLDAFTSYTSTVNIQLQFYQLDFLIVCHRLKASHHCITIECMSIKLGLVF